MDALSLGGLIEYVCDAHAQTRDEVGPMITRHEGAWAYCAGNGAADHRWRRVTPVARDVLDREGRAPGIPSGVEQRTEPTDQAAPDAK